MGFDLESELIADIISGKDVLLERALLIASGLRTEEELSDYVRKIDTLHERFTDYARNTELAHVPKRIPFFTRTRGNTELDEYTKAKSLFQFLWEGKPARYNCNFLLTDVLDAQLSETAEGVGNCLGLTSLYTVLALRENLNASIVDLGNHIVSRLNINNILYTVENTRENGFDRASASANCAEDLPNTYLVGMVICCRGIAKGRARDYKGMIEDLEKAVILNVPHKNAFIKSCLFKKMFFDNMTDNPEQTLAFYRTAIQAMPHNPRLYVLRGDLRNKHGDKTGATLDYMKAGNIIGRDVVDCDGTGVIEIGEEDLLSEEEFLRVSNRI